MLKFIGKRLIMLIPVLLGISFIIFAIMSFSPGDPVRMKLGDGASEEEVTAMREEMGLNDPFLVQYARFIVNALHGDFGKSYRNNVDVFNELIARFPNTLKLAICGILISIIIGIPVGVISAVKQYSLLDHVCTVSALLMTSLPSFWLGLMMMLLFANTLHWLPATGADSWKHFIMPSIAVAATTLATLIRMTRSTMLEVIRQDYIRTARAKGATERTVVFKHALRNALLPVVTVIGNNFGALLGGALIAETVFAIPGLGSLMVASVRAKDTPMVMASVLFVAIAVGIVNLIVDVLYAYIDPRIKSQYMGVKK
ncbi:ABC transporter permease [Dysosmobacter sp.]|uniref:ABC transporter permease n=1 Tax=Dysosmobacter sp. TaxID=2591382 RepID=UPI002A846848|nr:ABC transporter permease [Dysosmobacter sp.]MDY3282513.1 ABC transporter permease [Dysosmobacter sp.]